MKKMMAVLLAVVMVFGLLPFAQLAEIDLSGLFVRAQAAEIVASGNCGYYDWEIDDGPDEVFFTLDSDGLLTITGTGRIGAYDIDEEIPWCSYRTQIQSVMIGNGVTGILYSSFYGCSNMTSVEIPDSVTSIGSDAFFGCTSLESVTIPDSVTSIGGSAFSGCSSLESMTIPDSVTSIGSCAFSGCSSLESVTIPAGVTSIGTEAFSGCRNMNAVYITDLAAWCNISFYRYYSYNNGYHYTTNNPLVFAHNLYVNGELATDIVIPDGVTSISNCAFYGCSSLESVIIPDGVTSINDYAFYNCSSLESVTIPASVTSIGSSAFSGCSSLESVTIPAGVTNIGSYAFSGCSSLESVTIPAGVTSIGSDAFDASGLSRIYYPGTREAWDALGVSDDAINYAAIYCAGSESQVVKQGMCGRNISYLLDDTGTLTLTGTGAMLDYSDSSPAPWNSVMDRIRIVKVSEGITTIGSYAFCGCYYLHVIDIPEGLAEIGTTAFGNCWHLRSVTIPASVTKLAGAYNDEDWYDSRSNCFYECYNLENVYINDLSAWIHIYDEIDNGSDLPEAEWSYNPFTTPYDLYLNGELVTNLMIPDGLTRINQTAFRNCSSLTSVTIPDGVTSIGKKAFSGCNNLASIAIPDGVTSIGSYAFSGCSSLASIAIPDGVTSIGEKLFSGCGSLSEIAIPDSVASISQDAFSGTALYQNDANWDGGVLYIGNCLIKANTDLVGAYTVREGTVCIADSAFAGIPGLYEITLPDSMKTIGNSAFSGCSDLETVNMGNGVTSIGDSVFYGCGNLSSITIPGSVTSIGGLAFFNCDLLTSVTIPNGVTSISYGAFRSCDSLTSITIPGSVTNIGRDALEYCNNLTDIYFRGTEEQWYAFDLWEDEYNYATVHFASGNIIRYDANGGTGAPANQSKVVGDTITLSTARPTRALTLTYDANGGEVDIQGKLPRMQFLGWNTFPDGSGDPYAPGATYADDADLTLYAQWKAVKAGALETPEREGYTFLGWFTARNGGEQVTAQTLLDGDLTVYAHWTNEPPHEHTPAQAVRENEIPATCEVDGACELVVYCADCGEELSRTAETLPATGHDYGAWTELNENEHRKICANDPSHVVTAPHAWDAGVVVSEATETENGEILYTCTVCGAEKTDEIVYGGHTHVWNLTETVREASCAEDGENLFTCVGCGETRTEAIPATGHSYGAWERQDAAYHRQVCMNDASHINTEPHVWNGGVVTKQATCDENGVMIYTCTVCKAKRAEAIPATGHEFGAWTRLNANEHKRVCINDETHFETAAHTWNAGVVTKQATCDEDGSKICTCTVCKTKKTVVIPASGHAYGAWTSVNDEQHRRVCANDETHIETGAHTWNSGVVTKAATTTATGVKTYTCTVCGKTRTETIPKLLSKIAVSAANVSTGIKLTWPQDANATGYYVVRKTGTESYKTLKKITSNATVTYTDTTVDSGTQYTYYVRSYRGTEKGSYTTKKITFLSAITPTLTNGSTGITVAWTKVTGASGYYVYRKEGTGSYDKVATISGSTTVKYVDTAVKDDNGIKFTYMVKAYKSTTVSSYTAKAIYRMTGVAISSLSNSAAGTMTVKWAKNAKATGYEIQYATNSKFTSAKTVTVSGASTVSKAIASLTKGSTYYVRVRVCKTVSSVKYYSAWSSAKSVKIAK